MTIAAGFRFDGGVLLCADSQYSYGGVFKTKGKKVMSGGFGKLPIKIGFAIAGDVARAKAAIRNIVKEIDSLPPSASADEVYEVIEIAMDRSYRAVFNHPSYDATRNEGPHFWLLICLWMEGQKAALLVTNEAVVEQVDTFDCKGSGEALFRYIIDDVYFKDMALQDLIALLAFVLHEIKEFDINVGFNSEFVTFFDAHKQFSQVAGYDVEHMQNFGSLTKREFFKYMFVMADLRRTDDEIIKAKELFEDNLVNLRRAYMEDKTNRKNIERLFQILTTEDPKSITLKFSRKP